MTAHKIHPLRSRYVVAGLAFLTGIGCHRGEPGALLPPPVPAVLTTVVHLRPEHPLSRRGTLASGASLRLGFSSPGTLATVRVTTGDVVRKGQVLARLNDGGSSAAILAAQASGARALRDYETTGALVGSGAVSPSHRDEAESALAIAQANTQLAFESASTRVLRSPIAGTVTERLARTGETVGAGTPVLVLEDTHRLVVKVRVNERDLARVKKGQLAKILVDRGGAVVPAVVTSIGPAPLEDGLYPIELSPSEPRTLETAHAHPDETRGAHLGTLVTVEFGELAPAIAIRVPLDAVVHRDGKTWALVVNTAPPATTVTLREIAIDRETGSDVVVRSGLNEGERVVREGAEFLEDGQPVRLLDGAG